MTIKQTLLQRSHSKCELCGSNSELTVYEVPPITDAKTEQSILICDTCHSQVDGSTDMDTHHWRCLNDSMWNQEPAVQVMVWRMLDRLRAEGWPQGLLDMLYLEEEVQQWAEAEKSSIRNNNENLQPTKDSNGAVLNQGDTVTLIKDLVVKGANFTAKRGTMVKNISLTSNLEQIEGRVNGTRIVLLSCFLKKQV